MLNSPRRRYRTMRIFSSADWCFTIASAVGFDVPGRWQGTFKGNARLVTFHRAAERSCGHVIDVCGDKDFTASTKKDANSFRDNLIKRELAGSSITRIFEAVRSIINFAESEAGIGMTNPFDRVYFNRKAGVDERAPLLFDVVRVLKADCRNTDDDLRWPVALVSETGMGLSEAGGLLG